MGEEEWERYERQVLGEVRKEWGSPIRKDIRVVRFTSTSKGWRNGRRVRRKYPRLIKLICYGPRCVSAERLAEGKGPVDDWATEIVGEMVPPGKSSLDVFLEELRRMGAR